jgi:hypothetical protein
MGLIGLTGLNGTNGTDGANGTNGINGADGAQGPIGPQGPQGIQGPAGPAGFGDSGSFWDDTTQGNGGVAPYAANTAYAMTYDTADIANNQGVSITSGSQVTFTHAGVYNIQFSAQLERTQGGSSSNVSIWLRENGVDVPLTDTDITVQSNATRLVAAWNFFAPVSCATTCDHYELMWSSESPYMSILYLPPQTAPARPAIPSVILTVNQVK